MLALALAPLQSQAPPFQRPDSQFSEGLPADVNHCRHYGRHIEGTELTVLFSTDLRCVPCCGRHRVPHLMALMECYATESQGPREGRLLERTKIDPGIATVYSLHI